ncbi:Disease resistance protein [Corchorus olitorius]|uniref:Disease resistance protein n=1 Tax=Corchorus olitorius TaxID=93759 RepID=A0A1R3G859_9ROSI|nr:Disease resistance protein [Corchorus olitorius]
MAEAIVTVVVERMVDLLAHEAIFLRGVGKEKGRLEAELERMKSALQDADRKQDQNQLSRTLVKQIREIAYEAEDVLDTYILKVAHQHQNRCNSSNIFTRVMTKWYSKRSHLHTIEDHVRAIQTKLDDIFKSLTVYKEISDDQGEIRSIANFRHGQQLFRRTYSHVKEDFIVSLNGISREVLAQLMKEEDSLRVVSIIGMGGIGKTTLANKLYHHIDVIRHFDSCAWIFISQQCMRREVFHEILVKVLSPSKEFRELMDKMKEDELMSTLRDVLKDKRYLVVLDDIWRSDHWNILKPAFPPGKKGSKILFTTRNKDVALLADPLSSPIELPLLTSDQSWELFRRKAFPGDGIELSQACQEEFEKLGKDMVKKCGGLPLAIVVLGGLLATKRSVAQWERVQRKFNPHLNEYGAVPVNEILVLSYHDLPLHLKPCFLYFGHYPEDWEISKKTLIRLWIAEGFIPPPLESGGLLMEDEAEQCLEDLINRCLVQVGRIDNTGTGVKTCRVHDLLRDLCVEKAREENFLGIIQPASSVNNGPFCVNLAESKERRIAIHPSKRRVCLEGKHPKLRTLLLFQDEEMIEVDISKCSNFRLLRVLNLVKGDVQRGFKWHVSSKIGELHHLRYLKMICSEEIILPGSISKLKSLHTLHLECRGLTITPEILFKLERLRHFSVKGKRWLSKSCSLFDGVNIYLLPRDTSTTNIETLKYIEVGQNFIRNNAMLSLTCTRSLGLIFQRSTDVEPILKSLSELRCLRSLHMSSSNYSVAYSNLEPLSHCHHISKLFLGGMIQADDLILNPTRPVLRFLPKNITKLTLMFSEMLLDPMAELEKLQHLRILRLGDKSYGGTKLICSANGFPQLDYLEMTSLVNLEEWQIEEGAMARLRSFKLSHCMKLRMLPEGLQNITTLQGMSLQFVSSSLVERIQVINGREGEDFFKVRHIPSIQIHRL